jgi:molecular chaperone HscB
MTYFELFDIPVALHVNVATIKTKFYQLSRQYHPDFFSQATSYEQEEVLEKSSLVNKAFKTFTDKEATLKYVLQLKGLLEDEEKYKLPPDFLMEMMALNEALMDARMEANEAKITSCKLQVSSTVNEIYEPVKSIIENYKDGVTTEKELLQVKDYYFKKKYLTRILASTK